MKCPRCHESKYIHVSESKDRLLFRLFLSRCLRCHYCGERFIAPVWKQILPAPAKATRATRTASHRPVMRHRSAMG